MRILTLLLCGLLAGALMQAPVRPDFSGDWVLDPSKTTAPPDLVVEPRKTRDVPPRYPPDALRAGITGKVVLEVLLDSQGKVKDLRVIRSVRELNQAAQDAVSRWEYTPTIIGGVPVEAIITVRVTFSMSGEPQMGVPVGSPSWPSQSSRAIRPALDRGYTASELALTQNDRELKLVRKIEDRREEIKYRFDGNPNSNRLLGTASALDGTSSYVSRWEGGRLISKITWVGPYGQRERTETIWLDGDLLKIQTSIATAAPGAEPGVITQVFSRKQ